MNKKPAAPEGAPTVGGVVPKDPSLNPSTGLPYAVEADEAAKAKAVAEKPKGRPTSAPAKKAAVPVPAKKAAPAKKVAAKSVPAVAVKKKR